jgi:hypothetical protein
MIAEVSGTGLRAIEMVEQMLGEACIYLLCRIKCLNCALKQCRSSVVGRQDERNKLEASRESENNKRQR